MSQSTKIAIQGAVGSFSYQAAEIFAKTLNTNDIEYVSFDTFAELFGKMKELGITYGVIPVENSTVGSIGVNYDLLWQNPVTVLQEIIIPIEHHLIALPGSTIKDIKAVYSHPVALEQCRIFFKEHPHTTPVVFWDTGGAVIHIKESNNKTLAAIASKQAAEKYGLSIIKKNLEDYSANSTRFCAFVNKELTIKENMSLPARSKCYLLWN